MTKDEEELYIRTAIEGAKALDPKLKYILAFRRGAVHRRVIELIGETLRKEGVHVWIIETHFDPTDALKVYKLIPEEPI